MLNDLRRVPARVAAAVILGSALLTMLLFAGVDAVVGDDSEPASSESAPEPIVLDDPYPDTPRGSAPSEPPEPSPDRPRVPLRRLVGQKVMGRMTGTEPSAALLRRIRRGEVGGIVIFPNNVGSPSGLRSALERLRDAARAGGSAGFLVAVDQEGGPVKRLPGGPPDRSPREIAATGRESVAEDEGAATGDYLSGLGINVDLAPVMDVPTAPGSFIRARSFGSDPETVARLATAFARGLSASGVAATAKHFPGLGAATANTDTAQSTVPGSRAELRPHLEPFRTAVDAGVGLVMMSTAVYPGYDPGTPAAFSRTIVGTELRDRLGFDGVVITDDLETPAVAAQTTPAEAAVTCAAAGVDVVLFAKTESASVAGFDRLLVAARSGRLDRGELERSYERIQRLQASLG